MKKIIWILLLVVVFTGCSTINTLEAGKGGKTFDVHGKTYDEVWAAAVVTASRSLTIVISEKEEGVLKAEKAAGMATWGEVVGIFISPGNSEGESYVVEVQSLKRSTLTITGQDWTNTIIAGMKVELNQ